MSIEGEKASWKIIRRTWQLDCRHALRYLPRVKAAHIALPLGKKMNVRMAAQVLSSSMNAAIKTLVDNNCFPGSVQPLTLSTAKFVKSVGCALNDNLNRLQSNNYGCGWTPVTMSDGDGAGQMCRNCFKKYYTCISILV